MESHSLSFKMFVEIIPFVLQGELADLLTDVPDGFTEGDVGLDLPLHTQRAIKQAAKWSERSP